jgi:hypothetical protein
VPISTSCLAVKCHIQSPISRRPAKSRFSFRRGMNEIDYQTIKATCITTLQLMTAINAVLRCRASVTYDRS